MKLKILKNFFIFLMAGFLVLQAVGFFVLFANPVNVSAAEETPTTFEPQVKIPGEKFTTKGKFEFTKENRGTLIAQYIQSLYKFIIAAIGILATVMIMGGGLIWLTAGGNSAQISKAKEWVTGAIAGLMIAFASYAILEILNPSLVTFKSLNINTIKEVSMKQFCCSSSSGQTYAVGKDGKCPAGYDLKCDEEKKCGKEQPTSDKYSCTTTNNAVGDCCDEKYGKFVSDIPGQCSKMSSSGIVTIDPCGLEQFCFKTTLPPTYEEKWKCTNR